MFSLLGGDYMNTLINVFFITFIINIFIVFYSIYTFFDIKISHNLQGSKLDIKKRNFM